jgi:hypothetical protein
MRSNACDRAQSRSLCWRLRPPIRSCVLVSFFARPDDPRSGVASFTALGEMTGSARRACARRSGITRTSDLLRIPFCPIETWLQKQCRAGHPAASETKEGDMRAKCLLVAATVVALTLGTAQTALADNNATGSIGAVQTGNVWVTPSAGASQSGTSAAVSAPTSIAGTGNNTATNSVGAVQVGGGNTSSGSTGAVQSSPVSSSPSVSAGAGGQSVTAGAPVTVGGSGGTPRPARPAPFSSGRQFVHGLGWRPPGRIGSGCAGNRRVHRRRGRVGVVPGRGLRERQRRDGVERRGAARRR